MHPPFSFGECSICIKLQFLPAFLKIRHQLVQQFPKLRTVVFNLVVAELVNDDIVDAIFWCLDQRQI